MEHLVLKGQEIRSLQQLREQFDEEEVLAAAMDGTLGNWLRYCFYPREAEAVDLLPKQDNPQLLSQLYRILQVQTDRDLEVEQRKRAVLEQVTQDPAILSKAQVAATNQQELAELLHQHTGTIYLCKGPFSIPIQTGKTHYIGVGAPEVEPRFTEEQYRRAGITFQDVELPAAEQDGARREAEQAAEAYGYDEFDREHCTLAVLFHEALKAGCPVPVIHLEVPGADDLVEKDFTSRSAAERAARNLLNPAYDLAGTYFDPDKGACLSGKLAGELVAELLRRTKTLLRNLEHADPKLLGELKGKLDRAEEDLKAQLDDELRRSADYYQMYKREYFLDAVEIEEFRENDEVFDSNLLGFVLDHLTGGISFNVFNLPEVLMELEEDVRNRANTFYGVGFQCYKDLCADIEKIAEEIGHDLSDDVLKQWGLLPRTA